MPSISTNVHIRDTSEPRVVIHNGGTSPDEYKVLEIGEYPNIIAVFLSLEGYRHLLTTFIGLAGSLDEQDKVDVEAHMLLVRDLKTMQDYSVINVGLETLMKRVLSVAYERHVGLDDTCVGCGTVRGLTHLNDCAIGEAEKQVGR